MKKIIFLTILLGLSMAAYENCFTEVTDQTSTTIVSTINYQTFEQAKAACYLQSECLSINYIKINENTKAYQLRGALSQNKSQNSINVYQKILNCKISNDDSKKVPKFIKNQNMKFSETINSGKLYLTYQEAETTCLNNSNCDGITKLKAQSLSCYSKLATKVDYLYVLCKGTLVKDNTGDSVESYTKSTNLKKSQQYNYSVYVGSICSGCVQNCKDYSSLDHAQDACNNEPLCKAISYTTQQNNSTLSSYQLRSNSTPTVTKGYDISYVRGNMIENNIGINITINSNIIQVSYDSYLPGCVDNCRDYKTLVEALDECRKYDTCFGITYSTKEKGGPSSANAYNGYGGYQLRGSNSFIQSRSGEISYLKPINYQPNSQTQTCAYNKQLGMQYKQVDYSTSKNYSSMQNATLACSKLVNCTGIYTNESNKEYKISFGKSYESPVIYQKGTCSNEDLSIYPILYTECNYGGNKLILKNSTQSVDLKSYQSLFIPTINSVSISSSQNNDKEAAQIFNYSIICKAGIITLQNDNKKNSNNGLMIIKVTKNPKS